MVVKGGINTKEFAQQMASTEFSFVPRKAQAETQSSMITGTITLKTEVCRSKEVKLETSDLL